MSVRHFHEEDSAASSGRVVVQMKVVTELTGQVPSPLWLESGRQKVDKEPGRLMYLKPDVFSSLLFCGGSSSSSSSTRKLLFISSHSPINSLTIIQYKPSQAKLSCNDSSSHVRSKEP